MHPPNVAAAAMMRRPVLRTLGRGDLEEAIALCEQDLVTNLFAVTRLYAMAANMRYAGGQAWGWYERGELRSVCWSGANLVPAMATEQAAEAFAEQAQRTGRTCSSIVGPADAVMTMWRRLRPVWGAAREVRARQPLMVLDHPPLVAPDPQVRRALESELPLVLPACISMFTEEVGYSPIGGDGGALYQSQIAGLVAMGRVYLRMNPGPRGPEVLFKAELGSVHPGAVQVQGVWVAPQYRGQKLAAPAVAAVAEAVQREVAPVVSLYVNDFNTRAISVYRRVGFREVGSLATVLF